MLGSSRFRDLTSELLGKDIHDYVIPTKINLPISHKVIQIATGDNHILFLTGIQS